MSTLALDMATRTGWAVARDGELLRADVIHLPSKLGEGARLDAFKWWVRRTLRAYQVTRIVYEEALPGAHRRGRLIGPSLRAVLLCEAFGYGIPVEGVYPSTLKKYATGKGNAPKADVIVAAYDRWPGADVRDDNQADALMLLAWALENQPEKEEK